MITIQIALLLFNLGGISSRGICKVFLVLNQALNLGLKVPTHATILLWVKKHGLSNFKEKSYFEKKKWVLIIDESIQMGNKKLLVVMLVLATRINNPKALSYQDLTPLIIKSSTSWKGKEIKEAIENQVAISQISYVVSDNGSNLKLSHQLLGLSHIEDINHRFSSFLSKIYKKDVIFEDYIKALSCFRAKNSLSKYAHLIPPNQRSICRFMNLTPLFRWGKNVIELLKTDKITVEEKEKIGFVLSYESFILETLEILETLNSIQKRLKENHLSQVTVDASLVEMKKIKGEKGVQILLLVEGYFSNTLAKMGVDETVFCSSDILESCFGKYKEVVKSNKNMGITDISLSISSLSSSCSPSEIKTAMENTKNSHLKAWREKNIGESLFQKKTNLYKKQGGGV